MQHISDSHPLLTPWLAMATVPKMSPQKWHSLLNGLELTPQQLLLDEAISQTTSMTNDTLSSVMTLRSFINWRQVERAIAWQQSSENNHILTRESRHWPVGFAQLSSPPLVLFATGDVLKLKAVQVAIVGSRRATMSGLRQAAIFAGELSQAGVTITSGLATGIDSAAHKGAMMYKGGTVAFLGTGTDIVYPARNQVLANAIGTEGGLLVSEFFPGTTARRFHFPQRNRLIAAISAGTLVIEAGLKSGTLITANLAADLGRDVFALPGNVSSPQSQGCHALIQQGAKLVVSAVDIIEELALVGVNEPRSYREKQQKSKEQNLATDKLLDSVEFDVTGVDIIAERSAQPVSVVMATLLEYELRGLVAAVPGGYVKLRGK